MEQKKILIAEDDLFLRELYHETLTEEQYAVETAVDGEDAYTKIHQGGYDLILLDIIMPKMDGISVMEKLQTNPPVSPNGPVIFLTNLDKDDKIKQALTYGNGYIIKSQITPGDLVAEVAKYLQ